MNATNQVLLLLFCFIVDIIGNAVKDADMNEIDKIMDDLQAEIDKNMKGGARRHGDTAMEDIIQTNQDSEKTLLNKAKHAKANKKKHFQQEAATIDHLVEGDILQDEQSKRHSQIENQKRSAVVNPISLWPGGVVPYEINFEKVDPSSKDVAVHYDGEKAIIKSMQLIAHISCIKFRKKTAQDKHFIHFVNKEPGCFANIGRRLSETKVNLGQGCVVESVIVHELFHALGFYHEQSRADRDSHVVLYWNNMKPKFYNQFYKHNYGNSKTFGKYDLNSIMHYANKDFSQNGENTIEAIIDKKIPLGNKHISKPDQIELNRLYQCKPTIQPCLNSVDGNFCDKMAFFGQCKKSYEKWMLKHCCKSCMKV